MYVDTVSISSANSEQVASVALTSMNQDVSFSKEVKSGSDSYQIV
jgi:hypothetical protein